MEPKLYEMFLRTGIARVHVDAILNWLPSGECDQLVEAYNTDDEPRIVRGTIDRFWDHMTENKAT